MKVAIEKVTPAKAKEYLASNTSNRKLRKSALERYVRDMLAGRWALTHQGIVFDDTGQLIDGQHRLTAVVQSGVSVKMMVTRGLPSRQGEVLARDCMDAGILRSVADQLQLEHGVKNAPAVASAARHLCEVMCGHDGRLSVHMALAVVAEYGKEINDVIAAAARTLPAMRRGPVVAGLALVTANGEDAVLWADSVIHGHNLQPGRAALELRNFILGARSSIHKEVRAITRGVLAAFEADARGVMWHPGAPSTKALAWFRAQDPHASRLARMKAALAHDQLAPNPRMRKAAEAGN